MPSKIDKKINYLTFGFKETGDLKYLFKLNRILSEYLSNSVEDYLEENEYDISEVKESVLKASIWTQDNTSQTDLTYRVGCKD